MSDVEGSNNEFGAPSTAPVLDMVKFGAARLRLIDKCPYFATPLYAMQLKSAPGLGTFAVDRSWNLYVDPVVMDQWTVPQVTTALLHEMFHLLRDHADRSQSKGVSSTQRDRMSWNLAADAEINDDLVSMGFEFPPIDFALPKKFGLEDDGLAEIYYDAIRGEDEEESGQGSEGDSDESSESSGDNQSNSSSSGDDGESGENDTFGEGSGEGSDDNGQGGSGSSSGQDGDGGEQGDVCGGNCGSGADGQPRDYEDVSSQDGRNASVSEVQADLIRRKAAEDIKEFVTSRGQGSIPGEWERWADDLLHPKANWRAVLSATCQFALATVSGAVDYTYSRPSRRQAAGFILPAMRRPIPEVAIVVDTSGSMGTDLVTEALGEVEGVCRASGGRVKVLAVDAAVATVSRVSRARDVELAGGGGTDMRVGIDAAIQLRPKPDVIIVLTDGYTPWPKGPHPGVKLIVGLVGENAPDGPDWATSIHINDD